MSDTIQIDDQSLMSLYLKLMLAPKPKLTLSTELPTTTFVQEKVTIDSNHLNRFNKLCDYEQAPLLITYPYTLTGKLLLNLLSHRSFPIKCAGVLHLRNTIRLHEKLLLDETYSLSANVKNSFFSDKGLEFEIAFKMTSRDKVYWECSSFFLKRSGVRNKDFNRTTNHDLEKLDADKLKHHSFNIPSDIGKRYAKVSSDFNPIHISNIAAKLFGHSRSIAHGMWVISKALSLTNKTDYTFLDVEFKGPSPTNSEAFFIQEKDSINVFCKGNPRPVVLSEVK